METETCDLCGMEFEEGDQKVDDGGEVAHKSCVAQWFRRNFGREGLA